MKNLSTKKLSIIIPAYNEEATIIKLLDLVSKIKLPHNMLKEIIVVDDGSTDNTRSLVKDYIFVHNRDDIIFVSKHNNGKGSAVIKGIELSTGNVIIIQDADLELDPNQISSLVTPILKGHMNVVYGSRFTKGMHKDQKLKFYIGSWVVTKLINFLYGTKLTDTSTCYKTFKSSVLKSCVLTEKSFGFDPEVTTILVRRKIAIFELPISYTPRDVKDGKKINYKDGLRAIWIVFRNRFKSINRLVK